MSSTISGHRMVYPALLSGVEPATLPSDASLSSTTQSLNFTQRLPIEIIRMIFFKARENISALSKVNKRCRTIAYSEELFKQIAGSSCFDAQDLKKYFGVLGMGDPQLPKRTELGFEVGDPKQTADAGKRVTTLKNLASKTVDAGKRVTYLNNLASDFMLTLIPPSIKVKDQNGNDKEIVLDSGDAVKEMLLYQKAGHRIGFDPNSWSQAMAEKRKIEKTPFWVWINKQVIGRNKFYTGQKEDVQKKSLREPKANVSDLIDTMVSVLMNYVKTGERCFGWDQKNKKYTIISVNDTTNRLRLGVRFALAGLYVHYYDGHGISDTGVVVARKSIGP